MRKPQEVPLKPTIETLVITQDTTLERGAVLNARIVVAACHVVIDGNGATLQGPATLGDMDSFEGAGVAVSMDGCTNVTVKNLKAKAFETGLEMRDCIACTVEACDFSDNYDNQKFGWGELPARGGIICNRVRYSVFRGNKAQNVWDGLHLRDCDDNLAMSNDFSHCSNVCAKLWNSSRNKFIENNLSYGIRIDRAAGEVHARDSTSVLIESGSNDNYWYRNDITNGGDGVFIRPLNGWLSTGNIFIENDTSYANNNCIEAWSPENVFIRNKANHGSYGFWLGGSDKTLLIGNEASWNGLPDGYHNAPEKVFGHGGIVIVSASATHVLLDGNRCAHNNGGGIVFRGDVASEGRNWRIRHWLIQNNHLEENRWGIHGRFADEIVLGPNESVRNENHDELGDVENVRLGQGGDARPPFAKLAGPTRAFVGLPVEFSARLSRDPADLPLSYYWDLDGDRLQGETVRYTFDKPGLFRVGLTVANPTLSALDWIDVVVSDLQADEIGTEGQADDWSGDASEFADDPDAVEGRHSLRFVCRPKEGGLPWVSYPKAGDAHWNLEGKSRLVFWLKATNTNVFAWQNDEISVKLAGPGGEWLFKPKAKNWIWSAAHSEARGNWLRVQIPLEGDDEWALEAAGSLDRKQVNSFSLALDSTGGDPFIVKLDGLRFE